MIGSAWSIASLSGQRRDHGVQAYAVAAGEVLDGLRVGPVGDDKRVGDDRGGLFLAGELEGSP